MKTELLAALALLSDHVESLPDDPTPPSAPTNLFSVLETYYALSSGPLVIGIGWDDGPSGCTPYLEYRSAEGNPSGPQEWTELISSEAHGDHGEKGTLVLQNPVDQTLEFRVRFSLAGLDSPWSDILPVAANDLIPA